MFNKRMNRRHSPISAILVGAMLLVASNAAAEEIATPAKEKLDRGQAGYTANCVVCHQANGQGIPSAFPPLAASDFLKAPYAEAINAVVKGLNGEVTVNGVKYNSVMPPLANLSDEQISDILTFVVNSWGNPGGEITADQVKSAR